MLRIIVILTIAMALHPSVNSFLGPHSSNLDVPLAEAHRVDIYVGNFTTQSPSIDGAFSNSEWADATPVSGPLGIFYFMNDNVNLYIAARMDDNSLSGRTLEIFFDSAHDGKLNMGDDILAFREEYSDDSISFIAQNTFGYSADETLDGTRDGMGAASTGSNYVFFEFSHPLCSSDKTHDFCLSAGQVAGFSMRYVKDGQGTDWPEPLSIDAYSWGDIVVADSRGIPEKIDPPLRTEICGDGKDNDSDGKVDEADLPPRPGVNWSNCLLENANMTGADLTNANLQFAVLTGSDLRSAKLDNADMLGANLGATDLSLASLQNTNLNGVDLQGAKLINAHLQYADLQHASLSKANLTGADLRGAIFREATLSGADLTDAIIEDADLRRAYLSGMDLQGLDFAGTNLRDADLSETNLESVNLAYNNLTEVGLNSANLHNANMVGAILWRANLDGADLSESDLHTANLRFAYMDGADLTGTILDGPVLPWYTGINLRQGDYFTYKICYAKYQNCTSFEMRLWISGETDRFWDTEVHFLDYDGRTILDSIKIDKITGQLVGGNQENNKLLNGYESISHFSGFANNTAPRDFDAVTWYPLQPGDGPLKLLSKEPVAVQETKFEATIRGSEDGNLKYWMVQDMPFPIKGFHSTENELDSNSKLLFQFELLDYGNSPASPESRGIFGLGEIVILTAAIVLGIGLLVFLLFRRKKVI